MKRKTIGYLIAGMLIILADQLTKWIAVNYWYDGYLVTSFLSFRVTINRGISWGLLSSAETNTLLFLAISFCILLLTFGLAVYAFRRYKQGYSVYGELLVVSGSCSNIIDRCFQKGVIDFIVVHWHDYVWPVFNLADMAIVCGVGIMFFSYLTRNE